MKISPWFTAAGVLLVMALLVAGLAPVSAGADRLPGDYSAIDAYVKAEMEKSSIPGLAYGIIKDGQILHLAAFGVAGPDGRSMTTGTPLNVCSVGKTFTALAVRQLINAGKVEMDAPLQRYLPWFRVAPLPGQAAGLAAGAQITIRQLLEHTSGFSTAAGQDTALFNPGPTAEELVRGLAQVQLDRPPGSSREYSNLNYLALGVLVEAVSGQPYESYIQEHIFQPLGMKNSYASFAAARQNGLGQGYRLLFGIPTPGDELEIQALMAAGFHISTAEDLARYAAAFADSGNFNGVSILTPDGKPAEELDYSIDWDPIPSAGLDRVDGHSGGCIHYSSGLLIQPAAHYAVVALSNANSGQLGFTKAAFDIALDAFRLGQGGLPQPSKTYASQAYLVIDAILALMIAAVLWHTLRLRGWVSRVQASRRPAVAVAVVVIVDLLLPLGMLIFGQSLLSLDGSPLSGWSRIFGSTPDIGYPLFGVCVLLVAGGAVKLVGLIKVK